MYYLIDAGAGPHSQAVTTEYDTVFEVLREGVVILAEYLVTCKPPLKGQVAEELEDWVAGRVEVAAGYEVTVGAQRLKVGTVPKKRLNISHTLSPYQLAVLLKDGAPEWLERDFRAIGADYPHNGPDLRRTISNRLRKYGENSIQYGPGTYWDDDEQQEWYLRQVCIAYGLPVFGNEE